MSKDGKSQTRAPITVEAFADNAPPIVAQAKPKLEVQYHKDYTTNIYTWIRTRDCVAGEANVKSKKSVYLPMPYAMQAMDPAAPSVRVNPNKDTMGSWINPQWDPNYHQNLAYSAYLSRAQFPELTQFILRGLVGLVGATQPTIKLPTEMEYLLDKATPGGMGLHDLYLYTLIEVLITGRLTTVIDIDEELELPVMVPYAAESLINWKTVRSANSNKSDAKLTVFQEKVDAEDQSIYEQEQKLRQRVQILRDGFYQVDVYDEGVHQYTIIPSYKGEMLEFIPVVCCGSITNSFSVDPSPLAPIASAAVQIYMKNADLSNSEFISCNPTLVMTGVNDSQTPQALGSTVCIKIGDPEAKVYYPMTDTSALAHVLNHIASIYEQAIYQGAQLLDSSKKAAESAETTRLKQAASGATLIAVVGNVAKAMEKQLKIAATWMGVDESKVQVVPVTDFMSPTMSAQEQTALIASWVAGAISHITVLRAFYRAGMLENGEKIEDEQKRVEEERKEREKRLLDNMKKMKEQSGNPDDPKNEGTKPGSASPAVKDKQQTDKGDDAT